MYRFAAPTLLPGSGILALATLAAVSATAPMPLGGQNLQLPLPSKVCPISPLDDPGPRLEVHIFQPSCDQPLLPGKTAVVRVWAIWKENEDAKEDVDEIEVLVTVRAGGATVAGPAPHTFIRPKLETATWAAGTSEPWEPEIMRAAAHTFNVPFVPMRGTHASPLSVEIRPVDPGQSLPFPDQGSAAFEFVSGPERVLRIYYGFPFVGTQETPPRAATEWLRTADAAEEYIVQNFPIHAVKRAGYHVVKPQIGPEEVGGPSESQPAAELWWNHRYDTCGTSQCGFFGSQRADDRLTEEFEPLSEHAVVVVVAPEEVLGTGYEGKTFVPDGKTIKAGGTDWSVAISDWRDHPIIVLPDDAEPWVLGHELGHYFNGLGHYEAGTWGVSSLDPNGQDTQVSTGRGVGIQGWKTPLRGGGLGWNKHSVEGNGEDRTLEALMESGTVHRDIRQDYTPVRFVADRVYELLESNVPEVHPGVWAGAPPGDAGQDQDDGPVPLPTDDDLGLPPSGPSLHEDPRPTPASRAQEPHLMVTGAVALDGSAGHIDPVRRVSIPSPGASIGDPRFTLELVDEAGRVVASRAFDAAVGVWSDEEEPLAASPVVGYRDLLPQVDGARSVLLRGPSGEVLAAREASAGPPAVDRVAARLQEGTETARLTWQASDPDGDTLRFDLLYRPDDDTPWVQVATAVPGDALAVDTRGWSRGARPAVRVVALDGFHATAAEAPVDLDDVSVWSTFPADGAVESVGWVTATLSSDVDPATVSPATFSLSDAAGASLPARVGVDASGNRIWLAPEDPLDADSEYRATVAASVGDHQGRALGREVAWSFRTAPDETPPRVVRTSPRNGDITVDRNASVRVELSEPPDPSLVGPDALRLLAPDGAFVAGTVSHEPGTSTITFQSYSSLQSLTTYEIRLDPAVSDEAGNPVLAFPPPTFVTAGGMAPGGG